MAKGLDSASSLTGLYLKLKSDYGIAWAARYTFVPGASHVKQLLTRSEAEEASAAGVWLVNVWEMSPTSLAYFTPQNADRDAKVSLELAQSIGQPSGKPVYHTVDYDCKPAAAIFRHFEKINEIYNGAFAVGGYGNGDVLEELKTRGLISYEWLAGSKGWEGYLSEITHANIAQGKETTILARDVDLDVTSGNGGGWMVGR